ncbi:MAG: hypothetical protein KJ077_10780 [Anaerolineae bacterium]|nr:hypothetical protein [Anaerolineae bacterium]
MNHNRVSLTATNRPSCPFHGAQRGVRYAPQRAPCGCLWVWEIWPSPGYLLAIPFPGSPVLEPANSPSFTPSPALS